MNTIDDNITIYRACPSKIFPPPLWSADHTRQNFPLSFDWLWASDQSLTQGGVFMRSDGSGPKKTVRQCG